MGTFHTTQTYILYLGNHFIESQLVYWDPQPTMLSRASLRLILGLQLAASIPAAALR